MHNTPSVLLITDKESDQHPIMNIMRESQFHQTRLITRLSLPADPREAQNTAAVLIRPMGTVTGTLEAVQQSIACFPGSTVIVLVEKADEAMTVKVLEEGGHCLRYTDLNARILDRAVRSWRERNMSLTLLHEAHDSLKLSEERFSKLFYANTLVGFSLATLSEGKLLQVNDTFLRVSGFTREEVIGKSVKELGLWDGRQKFIDRLKNGERVRNEEIQIRTKQGKLRHVLLSFEIIETDLGPNVLTLAQDLSGRLQSFVELRKSERNLDTLINSSSNPIWLVDGELRLVKGNRAFAEMLERFGEVLLPGDSIFLGSRKEDVVQRWRGWYDRARRGERFTVLNRGVSKKMEEAYSEVTFNPTYDEHNRLSGIGCFLNDVTEVRKTNDRLIATESRYRSLVENATDSIMVVNAEGDYLDVNAQACNLLGYSRDELLTMNRVEVVVGKESPATRQLRLAKLRQGKSLIENFVLRKKSGEVVDVESNGFMLPTGDFVGIVRDLTERKRAQKEEAALQKRLKAIFEGTNDAILLSDDSTRYVQVNPAAQRMLGYSQDELLAKKVADLVGFSSADLWTQFMEDGSQTGTIDLIKKNGEAVSCLYNAKANILPGLHLSILTDVTARKQAEDKVRQSEARLAEAQRLAQCGNWEMDFRTRRFKWSDELIRVFATSNADFPNNYEAFLSVVIESHRERVASEVSSIIKTLQPIEIEYDISTAEGEVRTVQSICYPRLNDAGEIIGLFGTAQNITARRKAEEALKESERKYRYLFEKNPLPMWIVDRDALTFLDVNESALKHYGYSRDEFLALPYPAVKAPEEIKQYIHLKDSQPNDPLNTGVWKHKTKNGSAIHAEIWLDNINFQERDACLMIMNDVTEKLRGQAELRASYDRLKQLTAHLERVREEERMRISREVHDELGQQLTGLKMNVFWISKMVPDPEVRRKLSDMLSLIDTTVKSVRRISSELRPGILDDLGLIPALESHVEEFEKRSGIKSRFTSAITEFHPCKDTSTHIFRIFQEALTNVARHSLATQVEAKLHHENGEVILLIADNGIGFEPGDLKDKKSLGLAGMKERALLFSGNLTVDSRMNGGTTIKLALSSNLNEGPS